MITNPQVGMKVKWIGGHSCREGCSGTIIEINVYSITVRFEGIALPNPSVWWCDPSQLEAIDLSPEETERRLDQQRRLEHAMKYL